MNASVCCQIFTLTLAFFNSKTSKYCVSYKGINCIFSKFGTAGVIISWS